MNTILNNDVLLIIFKMLNLNDRANLRLICRLFRDVCDSIKIKKLIVYERSECEIKQLPNTDQFYNYEDTVRVFDLNKFFNSQIILNQIKLIRLLVIIGFQYSQSNDNQIIELNTKFDNLQYLLLDSLRISNGQILKSSIEKLFLNFTVFVKIIDDNLETFELFAFSDLNSSNLKYLNVNCELNSNFFLKCCQANKLANLEELDFIINNLDILKLLNDQFVNLKLIKCASKVKFLIDNMVHIINSLREDLKVIYFGIQLNGKTIEIVKELFVHLNTHGLIQLMKGKLVYLNSPESIEILNEYGKAIDLIEFYKLIDWFLFFNLTRSYVGSINRNLFSKFTNLELMHLVLSNYLIIMFNEFLSSFTSVKVLKLINLDSLLNYGNNLLDLIPNLQSINELRIENFNKINFDFLFKLPNLKNLKLVLYYPIANSIILKLIKYYTKLSSLNVVYKKEDDSIDYELNELKQSINRFYLDELKTNKFNFKIITHKENELRFVRLCLFRDLSPENEYRLISQDLASDEVGKIFKMIKYKDNELNKLIF